MASLTHLRRLPVSEREDALQGWAIWLAANRHRLSRTFAQELAQAVRNLREDTIANDTGGHVALFDLDLRFREWLESGRETGKGHGPYEDDA